MSKVTRISATERMAAINAAYEANEKLDKPRDLLLIDILPEDRELAYYTLWARMGEITEAEWNEMVERRKKAQEERNSSKKRGRRR